MNTSTLHDGSTVIDIHNEPAGHPQRAESEGVFRTYLSVLEEGSAPSILENDVLFLYIESSFRAAHKVCSDRHFSPSEILDPSKVRKILAVTLKRADERPRFVS